MQQKNLEKRIIAFILSFLMIFSNLINVFGYEWDLEVPPIINNNDNIVITVYIATTGIDVIISINFVRKFVNQFDNFNNISFEEFWAIFNTLFDMLIFVISIFPIVSCICVYALSTYIFIVCNKFVDSDINAKIPQVTLPIIIDNTITNIIIEHILLLIFVFFIKYFIAGSIINEIINAIKNGI